MSQIVNNIFMCQLSTHLLSIHKKKIFQIIQVSPINSFSINPQIIFSKIFKYHQTTHFLSIHKRNISRNSYFTKLSTYFPSIHKKIFNGIQVSPKTSFDPNPHKKYLKEFKFHQSTKNYKWIDDLSYKVDVFPCKRN